MHSANVIPHNAPFTQQEIIFQSHSIGLQVMV